MDPRGALALPPRGVLKLVRTGQRAPEDAFGVGGRTLAVMPLSADVLTGDLMGGVTLRPAWLPVNKTDKEGPAGFRGRVVVPLGGEFEVWGPRWVLEKAAGRARWAGGQGLGRRTAGALSGWALAPHTQHLVREPPEAFPASAPKTRGITLGRRPS